MITALKLWETINQSKMAVDIHWQFLFLFSPSQQAELENWISPMCEQILHNQLHEPDEMIPLLKMLKRTRQSNDALQKCTAPIHIHFYYNKRKWPGYFNKNAYMTYSTNTIKTVLIKTTQTGMWRKVGELMCDRRALQQRHCRHNRGLTVNRSR